jgi:hypothetical protein
VKKVKMTETKLKTNAKIEGDCFSCQSFPLQTLIYNADDLEI